MSTTVSENGKDNPTGYQFGAFKGVFTPSILTILGVIMYLRFGWALGSVGLWPVLIMVTMASGITFLTGMSVSALATNRKVAGGGAYHIVSRSLGPETGTAIGLPLFFAQALSISFYVMGFSESIVATFAHRIPEWIAMLGLSDGTALYLTDQAPRIIGFAVLMILTVIAYLSADLALKTQFLVMVAIAVSLVAFFMGGPPDSLPDPSAYLPATHNFWVVFAVIFPAVTGILAGVAMSGDLKNPAKALPRGTFAAVLTGYAIYMALCIFLWMAVEDKSRLLHPMIAGQVARWKGPVLLGIWAASLSSAMGSLLGAPRTLQALARDRILPSVLGRGYGRGNDPRLATALAAIVAALGLLMGNLNAIAPVLTMFFLTAYGLLNISAGLEELVGIPSWRPTFRVPWWVALAAATACFSAMFMINAGATFLAMAFAISIYLVTKRRRLRSRWGDVRSAAYTFLVRLGIAALNERSVDPRTWQPNLLVLSGSPTTRWYLIELAHAISQNRGFLTVATVVPEDTPAVRLNSLWSTVRDYLRKRDVRAFVKILAADNPFVGMHMLVKAYGYGPVRPNTLLLGETENPDNYAAFAQLIALSCRQHQNLVIVREADAREKDPVENEPFLRMDLWWYGNQQNLGLMLALAHMLLDSPLWRQATLTLKTLVDAPEKQQDALERLETFIGKARIQAQARVLVRSADRPVFEDIRQHSNGANLVLLGMRAPNPDETVDAYQTYYRTLLAQTADLPPTALVLAAEDMDYYAIFDEE